MDETLEESALFVLSQTGGGRPVSWVEIASVELHHSSLMSASKCPRWSPHKRFERILRYCILSDRTETRATRGFKPLSASFR